MTEPVISAVVTRVERSHTLAGSVFCPRCSCRLGDASNPALPYARRCSSCGRAIAIRIRDAKLFIGIEDEDVAGEH